MSSLRSLFTVDKIKCFFQQCLTISLYKLQLSRSCDARGEILPCSLTQANSSLTLEKAFIDVDEVGEADNKLKENEDDTTENDLDDDLDIPWSVEQSDREVDDQRSDEVESQVAIDFGND